MDRSQTAFLMGDMKMVRFSNNEYVRSHGRDPRGTGVWAFRFDNDNEPYFTGPKSLTEAKEIARREAIVRRAKVVHVLP